MNILVSAFECNPNKGSEAGYGWYWATSLATKGYNTHCFTREVEKKDLEQKGTIENLTFHYISLPFGLEKLIDWSNIGMYVYYILWQWFVYKEAKRIHCDKKFKIAHHVTWGSLQQGSFLYKLGIPFIFGPAGGGQKSPRAFRTYFGKYWRREIIRNWVSDILVSFNPGFKNMIKKAKVVLVSNFESAVLAKNYGALNVEISLDAAFPTNFYPKKFIPKKRNTNKLKLLWIGRFLARKGLLLVLDVMKELKEYSHITLTIVGDGETREAVLSKIGEYQLENTVSLIGSVPYKEVKSFYSNHDLFLFTSLRDSGPGQLIEAMAYGMPVITLKLHGQAIIVTEETGFACPCPTPEIAIKNLKGAILSFYENIINITQMSKAAHSFALEQTWDKKIDEITNKYYPKS